MGRSTKRLSMCVLSAFWSIDRCVRVLILKESSTVAPVVPVAVHVLARKRSMSLRSRLGCESCERDLVVFPPLVQMVAEGVPETPTGTCRKRKRAPIQAVIAETQFAHGSRKNPSQRLLLSESFLRLSSPGQQWLSAGWCLSVGLVAERIVLSVFCQPASQPATSASRQ
jgi:hypothetical protein